MFKINLSFFCDGQAGGAPLVKPPRNWVSRTAPKQEVMRQFSGDWGFPSSLSTSTAFCRLKLCKVLHFERGGEFANDIILNLRGQFRIVPYFTPDNAARREISRILLQIRGRRIATLLQNGCRRMNIQGDHSTSSKPPVDFKTKVPL